MRARVRAAVATLDDDDRELLELRYVTSLNPREIVDVVDRFPTANAISQRILRIVKRLKELLETHDLTR